MHYNVLVLLSDAARITETAPLLVRSVYLLNYLLTEVVRPRTKILEYLYLYLLLRKRPVAIIQFIIGLPVGLDSCCACLQPLSL